MSGSRRTSRRRFLKSSAVSIGLAAPSVSHAAAPDRMQILGALGDTLVPSGRGKPGFKTFEAHGIIQEVDRTLGEIQTEDFEFFNRSSGPLFKGRTFLELREEERAGYLRAIISGERFRVPSDRERLLRIYKLVRVAVFRIFYSNFPQHRVARDARGIPVSGPGDSHQITNPNGKDLVTAWDIVGYRGPLSWQEEEARRSRAKLNHWHDNLDEVTPRYRQERDDD